MSVNPRSAIASCADYYLTIMHGFVCLSLYKAAPLRGSSRNVPWPLRGAFLGDRRATTCPVAEERVKYF